jgi:hypothetical protein
VAERRSAIVKVAEAMLTAEDEKISGRQFMVDEWNFVLYRA